MTEPCHGIAHLAHVELLTDSVAKSLDFFALAYRFPVSAQADGTTCRRGFDRKALGCSIGGVEGEGGHGRVYRFIDPDGHIFDSDYDTRRAEPARASMPSRRGGQCRRAADPGARLGTGPQEMTGLGHARGTPLAPTKH